MSDKKFFSKKAALAALVSGLALGSTVEAAISTPETSLEAKKSESSYTIALPTDLVLQPATDSEAVMVADHYSHRSHSSHSSHSSHRSHYSGY